VPNPSGQQLGYLSVWPAGESATGRLDPQQPNGHGRCQRRDRAGGNRWRRIDVYAYNTTDLLIDINGYFAAPGTGGLSMYPAAPCRVLDTRQNHGQPFMGEKR
jgi:hypothetical protein